MKLFIDTEFNEFQGELISMALVAEDGSEFYEVLECLNPKPWVKEHVMPVLNKEPVPHYLFKMKLYSFLGWFESIHLIADWPDDIRHFCDQIITGPGEMMNIPSFMCEVRRNISTVKSVVPHNALEDAIALHDDYLSKPFAK